MEENGLNFSEEELDELTSVLFEDVDKDATGTICYSEMKELMDRNPGLIENLSLSIERWLLPLPPEARKSRKKKVLVKKFTWQHLKNNRVSVIFFNIFLLINVSLDIFPNFSRPIFLFQLLLLGFRAYEYSHTNVYVMVARACGKAIQCSILSIEKVF